MERKKPPTLFTHLTFQVHTKMSNQLQPPAAAEFKPDLSAVPVVALESLRLRLTQLTHTLNSMHAQLMQSSMPSWPALHSQFNVILKQLMSLSETISQFSDILQRTVAYPLPNFPTSQQAGLLSTLLRKKPLPDVEDWMTSGRTVSKGVKIKMDEDFCMWATSEIGKQVENHEWEGFLTSKQIEAGELDTGLRSNEPALAAQSEGGWGIEKVISIMAQGPIDS